VFNNLSVLQLAANTVYSPSNFANYVVGTFKFFYILCEISTIVSDKLRE